MDMDAPSVHLNRLNCDVSGCDSSLETFQGRRSLHEREVYDCALHAALYALSFAVLLIRSQFTDSSHTLFCIVDLLPCWPIYGASASSLYYVAGCR